MATRLSPTVSPDTEFFWTGLRDHKLLIQRCTECQALRQPPRPMCPTCTSLDWDTVESSGRGTVYSYVMPQHPPMPFMEYPYIVALIELDEGVRLVSNLSRHRARRCRGRHARRSVLRTFDNDLVAAPVPARPLSEACEDNGLHVHRGTRHDHQGRAPALRAPRHTRAPHRTGGRRRALRPGAVEASSRRPTSSELRCRRPSEAAVMASSSWHCCSQRWGGASRRCRSTPPFFSGADPHRPARRRTASRSGHLPDVVKRQPPAHRGVDRTRPLRPDRARDHRAP